LHDEEHEKTKKSLLSPVKPTNDRETKQYNDAIGRRAVRIARSAISNRNDSKTPKWHPAIARDLVYSNVKHILHIAVSDSISWWELNNKDGIQIFVYDAEEVTLCKMEFYLTNENTDKFAAKDIFPIFKEFELRKQWDTLLQDLKVVEEIDECNDIAHASFGGNDVHDLCVLRSWRTPELGFSDNQYLLSSRSVLHPKAPEKEGIERGNILPSGFIVNNVDDGSIKVTYLMQISGSTLQFTLENIPAVTLKRFKNLMAWYGKLTSESVLDF